MLELPLLRYIYQNHKRESRYRQEGPSLTLPLTLTLLIFKDLEVDKSRTKESKGHKKKAIITR